MSTQKILSRRNLVVFVIGIALLLYFWVFGRSLDNYLVGDDWAFLQQVSAVHSLSDLASFFSFGTVTLVRPLQNIITWLLYSGVGTNAIFFHALSLLLDLANSALLGVLVYLLFTSEKNSNRQWAVLGAIAVSILFTFNWTHHEAVFWYSSNNELLTAFFRLSGLILYVLLLRRRDTPAWTFGIAIIALAVLALLSKESAVVFPLELVLFFLYFRITQPTKPIRLVTLIVPILVLLVVAGWLVLYWNGAPAGVIENGRGGVRLTLGTLQDWLVRIPLVFNSTIIRLDVVSQHAGTGLELIVSLALIALAFLRRRFVWLLALAWTIVILLPYAALFPASRMMEYLHITLLPIAPRYFYFITAGSSFFIVASVMWLVYEINTHIPNRIIQRGVYAILTIGFVLLVAVNTKRLLADEKGWDISGQTVFRLTQQLQPVVANLNPDDTLCLANLPDNNHLKWTFRNATWGVLYLTYNRFDYQIAPRTDTDPPIPMDHCTIHLIYDSTTDTFIRQ